jgi:hypothetical protein
VYTFVPGVSLQYAFSASFHTYGAAGYRAQQRPDSSAEGAEVAFVGSWFMAQIADITKAQAGCSYATAKVDGSSVITWTQLQARPPVNSRCAAPMQSAAKLGQLIDTWPARQRQLQRLEAARAAAAAEPTAPAGGPSPEQAAAAAAADEAACQGRGRGTAAAAAAAQAAEASQAAQAARAAANAGNGTESGELQYLELWAAHTAAAQTRGPLPERRARGAVAVASGARPKSRRNKEWQELYDLLGRDAAHFMPQQRQPPPQQAQRKRQDQQQQQEQQQRQQQPSQGHGQQQAARQPPDDGGGPGDSDCQGGGGSGGTQPPLGSDAGDGWGGGSGGTQPPPGWGEGCSPRSGGAGSQPPPPGWDEGCSPGSGGAGSQPPPSWVQPAGSGPQTQPSQASFEAPRALDGDGSSSGGGSCDDSETCSEPASDSGDSEGALSEDGECSFERADEEAAAAVTSSW